MTLSTLAQQNNFPGEAVFTDSELPVKYVLQTDASDGGLLVVFAGMNPPPPEPAKYSYVRTLQPTARNKLFILDDYGPRGCYYLGRDRDLDFERSIVELLLAITDQLKIGFADITAAGSSKGGFASLYYGIKYGFARAIAGGPQTCLGNYLYSAHGTFDNILTWIAGGRSESARDWCNALLFEVVKHSRHRPLVDLHVGSGDHHRTGHVKPFTDALDAAGGFSWTLDVGEYDKHGDLGEHFPPFLISRLC